MCGIIGYIGKLQAAPLILDGLRRLEYRGYDSAGMAIEHQGALGLLRSSGKLINLATKLNDHPLRGTVGIGHTRWATHGRPTEENAHPHTDCTGTLVVIHNGIIENYAVLKKELLASHTFKSETDTEVLVHMIEDEYRGNNLHAAVRKVLARVRGSYALVVLSAQEPDKLVVARQGSPLVVGLGDGENFVASDVPAFLASTQRAVFIEDGDTGVLTAQGFTCYGADGGEKQYAVQTITWSPVQAEKEGFKHFMLKEIFEQPRVISDTMRGRLMLEGCGIHLEEMNLAADWLRTISRVVVVACGTSWHSGLTGKFLFEQLCQLPVEVDYASEFRYRNLLVGPDTLVIAITQSGETADTLMAVRAAKKLGAKTLAICNVVGSSITRETDATVYTHAGPEIGVASTKAFTAQLTVLYIFALYLARLRRTISDAQLCELSEALYRVPQQVEQLLKKDGFLKELAQDYFKCTDFLYLGRGINYPVALEGALKLKEISYIHAEGYPAGEMKHGPIALIDESLPVVVIATEDHIREKVIGNIKEVNARGGTVVALVTDGDTEMIDLVDEAIYIPQCHPLVSPILNVIPLQLLAYHIAVRRGCDVDQPRNLAKSVTVE